MGWVYCCLWDWITRINRIYRINHYNDKLRLDLLLVMDLSLVMLLGGHLLLLLGLKPIEF